MTILEAPPPVSLSEGKVHLLHSGHRQAPGAVLAHRWGWPRENPETVRLVEARLTALRQLENGWDGEDASPPAPEIMRVVSRLAALPATRQMKVAAQFVPLVDGGVQVEWHGDEGDVVLEFSPGGPVEIYVRDVRSGSEVEGPLEGLEQDVVDLLNLLS